MVVIRVDDNAILKRLRPRTDDFVEVEQLNPPEKVKLPRTRVQAVYRVIGSQEG